jgi:hypothetical protein
MTPQEVFDSVATHLLTQNEQARATNMGPAGAACQYRTPYGLKCAFGCLIPDDMYSPQFEYKTIAYILDKTPYLDDLYRPHLSLLEKLQRVHDRSEPNKWKDHLATVAVSFGLNVDVLEKL